MDYLHLTKGSKTLSQSTLRESPRQGRYFNQIQHDHYYQVGSTNSFKMTPKFTKFIQINHILKTILLGLLFTTITILISVPLKSYHLLITLLKQLKPKLLQQLTPYDSIFAVDDPNHPHAANVTLIFLEEISVTVINNKFKEILKLEGFKKLKYKITNFHGYYFWEEDEEFDIKNHIYYENGLFSGHGDEDILNKYLSVAMVTGFKEKRPWWEVTVLGGYGGGKSVVVMRIHHCYADGYR